MIDKTRLSMAAELIRDNICLGAADYYCAGTGVEKQDFIPIVPQEFDGEIFAVDGSNAAICSWSVANLNLIRAGYAVYRGRDWRRTVVTYDDIFLADPRAWSGQFAPHLKRFDQGELDFKESDLDRLSSYFRELQEYNALAEAIDDASEGDLLIYDGSFDVFEPLRGVISQIFARAREKNVALAAIAKSSSLFWGEGLSLPFVTHTAIVGSMFLPRRPWFVSLKDKRVDHMRGKWDGTTYIVRFDGQSDHAFRVDMPSYLVDKTGDVLGKLSAYSCSAECSGYPHALFRAHRDLRITAQEGASLRLELMSMLERMGMSQSQIRVLMQDFHDVLEVRQGI